jgi:hypothetical protein
LLLCCLLLLSFLYQSKQGSPGATIDSSLEKNGWVGCAQDKGWFDGRVGQIWIEKVLKPYVRDADKALLLVDHCKVHLTSCFVQSANDLGIDVDYIPAGYTCVLQPVDVGVNATFKKAIRDFHHQWCLDTYPKITNKDRLPTPERDDVYDWVVQSFDTIIANTIRKTFAYIGLVDKDAYDDNDDDDVEEEPETADVLEVFFQDLGTENEVDVDPAELVEDFSALGI